MTTSDHDSTLAAYTAHWQRRDRELATAAGEDAHTLLRLAFGSDTPISNPDAAFLASILAVDAVHKGATSPQGSIYQPKRYDGYDVTLQDGRRATFGLITQGYSEGYSLEIRRAAR